MYLHLLYMHCFLFLCDCLNDGLFSNFYVCLFKCSLNIRTKVVYITLMEFKYAGGTPLNKDHQRMMVDPMFMIEFKVISNCCYTNWCYSNCCRTNCGHLTWMYLNVPEFTWLYLFLPEFTWFYLILRALTWIYVNWPKFTWIYLNLPEFMWIYVNLPEFT